MPPEVHEKLVLLIEDNPDDVALTIRAFEKNRISARLEVARDGAEAIDRLCGDRDAPLPAVVLLDLKLPKVDGLDVLRRLRGHARTALLPVVVLTLSNEARDVAEAYRAGANSYLRKPVDFTEFNRLVADVARYWLALNEPVPPGALEDLA